MEEEKLSLFEGTPNITGFFQNKNHKLRLRENFSSNSSMKRSDGSNFMKKSNPNEKDLIQDLLVVPTSNRRMSGSFDTKEMSFNSNKSKRRGSILGPLITERIRNLSFDDSSNASDFLQK